MSSRRKAGCASKEIDLDSMIESGPQGAYEALQLYRSRAIRLKTKNDKQGAITALNQGAKTLFSNSYNNAGAELAILLVDFLMEFGEDVTSSQIDMLLELNSLFGLKSAAPAMDANTTTTAEVADANNHQNFSNKLEYLKNCVKWSIKYGSNSELGEPKIHVALGQCLWETPYPIPTTNNTTNNSNINTEQYQKALQLYHVQRSSAIYHLAVGEAPLQLNQLIQSIELTTVATKEEKEAKGINSKDRALTLGVLTFLSLDNLRDANELLNYYRLCLSSEGGGDGKDKRNPSPPKTTTTSGGGNNNKDKADAIKDNNANFEFAVESELEQFNRYLLLTCQRDAQPLFKTLVNKYADLMNFDENVPVLLMGPIGLKYFNIKQKVAVNPMMNMLQQMLSK